MASEGQRKVRILNGVAIKVSILYNRIHMFGYRWEHRRTRHKTAWRQKLNSVRKMLTERDSGLSRHGIDSRKTCASLDGRENTFLNTKGSTE